MAVVSANNGKTLVSDAMSRKVQTLRERLREEPDELELSPEEEDRYKILRYCAKTYEAGQKGRKTHETFDIAWSLYTGEMWNERRPSWRASITINKVRAFITFMQAIMTDNKPRISVEPMIPGSEDAADLLRKLVDRDWDENDMQLEASRFCLFGLIYGYAFMKVWYDPFADGGRGKHMVDVIPPHEVYCDANAKGIEDCEYWIHVRNMTMGWVRRNFPTRAMAVSKLKGMKNPEKSDQIKHRAFEKEGTGSAPRILSAMQINNNIVMPQAPMVHPNYKDEDHDLVEICEYWLKDDTLESYQRQVVKDGVGQIRMVAESDEEGAPLKAEPIMETAWRLKYPNGRLVVIAGGRVLLRDIPNPYQTSGFPITMWKDYDVGSIFGQGEPLTLRSMAVAINKIPSQVFEILQKMGNPGWKIKKGAGVNINAVTNKPGLCIPMEDTKEGLVPLDKPAIPGEFFSLFELISKGMAEVSGINEAVTGSIKADNTGFATIDQLQESSSAPIRLKVRNFESGLQRFGKLRIELIQQYDQGRTPLRVQDSYSPGVVQPAGSISQQFREYRNGDLQGQVEFRIAPISSLSTSPSGVWNRWLKLLEVKLIDTPWWHEKFRIEGYKSQLPRMLEEQKQQAMAEAATRAKSSRQGANKSASRSAAQSRRAPPSQLPSRGDLAMMR